MAFLCVMSMKAGLIRSMPEKHKPFVRAMPDDLKYDNTIDTVTAYRMYLSTKPWIHSNYSRTDHKPSWLDPTLAQEGL